MKSITKRRLKPRSIGRNTLNRRHKRRHSNRRWGAGQNGSREKRMIGGTIGYKGGGGLTGMFNRSSWKCDCKTISQDSSSKSAPDTAPDTAHVEPPSGQSRRPPARNSIAAAPGFRRREALPYFKDATSRKYLINDDFELVGIGGEPTIIINTKRGADALPENLKNRQFITKVNNIDIKVNTLAEFYQLLNHNNFYDKPVVLTVARGSSGGTGPRQFKVQVLLKKNVPMQGSAGGGKKTTYRRKKHVTRRKIHTKRMKVMVGGDVLRKNVTCTCTKKIKGNDQRADESASKGDDESASVSKGVSKGVSEGVIGDEDVDV